MKVFKYRNNDIKFALISPSFLCNYFLMLAMEWVVYIELVEAPVESQRGKIFYQIRSLLGH